jgi:hydrogenase/urease accessory protein HupE
MTSASTGVRWLTPLLLLIGTLLHVQPLGAHQFAPALLEVSETTPGRAAVRWKQPLVQVQGSRLRPILPGDCQGVGKPSVVPAGQGVVASWEITCPGGLVDKTLGVEDIATSGADVLLRVTLPDGRSIRQVLTADRPTFRVPRVESMLQVLRGYALLGVDHILTGWDHLVFVLGLVLLMGWGRRLLWTITSFTAGHSVTLALASLGLVRVPQAATEAAIALSIYLLAIELVRSRTGRVTVMQRWPWLVAGGFGLLHGLGFAGALAEIGLPQGEIPLALFAFNVGIELGQLAFVAVVLAVMWVAARLRVPWPPWAVRIPAYGIGSLAIYWFLERLARQVTFPS